MSPGGTDPGQGDTGRPWALKAENGRERPFYELRAEGNSGSAKVAEADLLGAARHEGGAGHLPAVLHGHGLHVPGLGAGLALHAVDLRDGGRGHRRNLHGQDRGHCNPAGIAPWQNPLCYLPQR